MNLKWIVIMLGTGTLLGTEISESKAPRPGSPSVTSPISVVVPALDLGAIQQALASINCKIGNVDQDVCEDTILSVLGDACNILGISISEALSILLECCQTNTFDVTEVFTVLQDIKDTITECCSTMTEDFQNTWTILADIQGTITECCTDILNTLTNCGMPMAITQAMIPFTITEPGLYCVAENLDGTGFAQTIRIESDNVVLDLNQHQVLNLVGSSINPALGVSNIVIKNGAIRNAAIGISVQANNVIIEDVLFYQTGLDDILLNGLVEDTPIQNISIINCQFFNGFIGIELGSNPVNDVIIQECKLFQKSSQGIFVPTGTHNNLVIQNTVFDQITGNNIQITPTLLTGLVVQNCVFNDGGSNGMLCGNVENITIKNCILDRLGGSAINFAVGTTNILIEDCNIEECSFGINIVGLTCNILNSVINQAVNDGISVTGSNVSIRNCDIMNHGASGITIDGNEVTIQSCDIRNNTLNGIIVSSQFVTIDNCDILTNGSNGVSLLSTTSSVIVNDCNINENTGNGIVSDGTSNTLTQNIVTGNVTGILLDAASVNNYLHSNTATSNVVVGIQNGGTNNHIYRNYSSFNGIADYIGVTPVNTPGGALTGTFDDFIANVEN